jgi:hypothetical protein
MSTSNDYSLISSSFIVQMTENCIQDVIDLRLFNFNLEKKSSIHH